MSTIILNKCNPNSTDVTLARKKIQTEILETNQDNRFLFWYDTNWDKQNYLYTDLLSVNGDLVNLSASEYTHNQTRIKLGCRQYQMVKYRPLYHSAIQKYVIPSYIEFCRTHNIRYLWYSFHAFNERLLRYAKSQNRLLSTTNSDEIPYYKYFKAEGLISYKGVEQYSFLCDLDQIND